MCKLIGKSNERILYKLSKSEILRLYSIFHVAMEITKTAHFTCQSKSFISVFSTCQVSAACKMQLFSCHNLANDIYSETAKTEFSHLNSISDNSNSSLTRIKFSSFDQIQSLDQILLTPPGCHSIRFSCCIIRKTLLKLPLRKFDFNWCNE